jgi:hypothetical protein
MNHPTDKVWCRGSSCWQYIHVCQTKECRCEEYRIKLAEMNDGKKMVRTKKPTKQTMRRTK